MAQVVALVGTGLATVSLVLLAYDLVGAQASAVLGTALAIRMVEYVLLTKLSRAFVPPHRWKTVLAILESVQCGVRLALTGSVLALWLHGTPFSILAGVGLIGLSDVTVLSGLAMISFIRKLRVDNDLLQEMIMDGALTRLRLVLMNALMPSVGFMPMALNDGMGAEAQRLLAAVVIGGIISSTFLTLLVLPVLCRWLHRDKGNQPQLPTGA